MKELQLDLGLTDEQMAELNHDTPNNDFHLIQLHRLLRYAFDSQEVRRQWFFNANPRTGYPAPFDRARKSGKDLYELCVGLEYFWST